MMIAFCTTCKGRADHISRTLPQNLGDNATHPNTSFVLLDYSSPDGLESYIKKNHQQDIESGRLHYFQHPTDGPFRMAHAKNMAHRLGMRIGADILVNLDADNFTGPDFAWYIEEYFRKCADGFLFANMVKGVLPRGINGRIAVPRDTFLRAGGYDERYERWSPDDKDFNARLRRMGCHGQTIPHQYLDAIRHNDKMRFREYPEAEEECYDDFEKVNSRTDTVVNFGQCGVGSVMHLRIKRDAWGWDSFPLLPIPTRIFGIGLHKTATTSLAAALDLLGFRTAHWPNAHWVKAAWTEMTTGGRSAAIEKYYAACDLPIPVLFRELDKAYPGSKFILTIRSEERWIESVRKHWDPAFNPHRDKWNTDPFTHKMHKIVYGQKGFDAEKFIARYRRHNEEVMEYFACREEDFAILDMDNMCDAELWERLGKLLCCPVHRVPYPQEYATAKHHHHHHHHAQDFQI